MSNDNARSGGFVAEKIEAVVLDWAGTTVDFGSCAPIAAILAALEQVGVPVTEDEARGAMGRAKRDHLASLLAIPAVAERWRAKFDRESNEADIDAIHAEFEKLQAECVVRHSDVIPGCADAIAACRERGLKIGSSTGYPRHLLELVADRARSEGYEPDVMLSADDISPGRPAPWLCMENARRLGVFPMSAVVKVDDTPVGVTAGRNAGSWAVGVVATGNEVGLNAQRFEALADGERAQRIATAEARLREAGAHFLIASIAELPGVVDQINARLASGERP